MNILYVGIDLAKNVFAVHGVNEAGGVELRHPKVVRAKLQLAQYAPEHAFQIQGPSTSGRPRFAPCDEPHTFSKLVERSRATCRCLGAGRLSEGLGEESRPRRPGSRFSLRVPPQIPSPQSTSTLRLTTHCRARSCSTHKARLATTSHRRPDLEPCPACREGVRSLAV